MSQIVLVWFPRNVTSNLAVVKTLAKPDSQVNASCWVMLNLRLAFTLVELKFVRKFFIVWPPNQSRHKWSQFICMCVLLLLFICFFYTAFCELRIRLATRTQVLTCFDVRVRMTRAYISVPDKSGCFSYSCDSNNPFNLNFNLLTLDQKNLASSLRSLWLFDANCPQCYAGYVRFSDPLNPPTRQLLHVMYFAANNTIYHIYDEDNFNLTAIC